MTFVIAHRGASVTHPENTLAAFTAALEQGADWVELDARRTADCALVVHHDAHLSDGRLIADVAAADLPSEVPSLEAALEACEPMGVNVEIKNVPVDPDYDESCWIAGAVVDLLRARDSRQEILVTSFDLATIDRVRELAPEVATGWLLFLAPDLTDAIKRAASHGHQAVHPFVAVVDEDVVRLAHSEGLTVNVWTVDDPARMRELAAAGVDGIITNVPDVARAAMRT